MFASLLTRIFIDSAWPHYWGCHRLPDRSFRLHGRQFHLCARCTGIVTGLALSPLFVLAIAASPLWFTAACVAMFIDGGTQYLGWRSSNNVLRFLVGLAFGSWLLPFLLVVGGF